MSECASPYERGDGRILVGDREEITELRRGGGATPAASLGGAEEAGSCEVWCRVEAERVNQLPIMPTISCSFSF